MSVWHGPVAAPPFLSGLEGELVSLRIAVEPRLLEDLLETLAELPFPVNPRIQHQVGANPSTVVEFPAYREKLDLVRASLGRGGFPAASLHVDRMLAHLKIG
ncbi:MAG: hypothetical protein JJE04_18055 [Acidobacteriia bacterium]|nr:hypothetical protein [Terriglobia bacterium]